MIKDILVCLEGSASSERATDLAIEIARELSARLMGLAIVDEPNIRAGAATGIGGASFKQHRDEVLLEDAHKKASDWLLLFEARCRDADIPTRVLEVRGRPAPKILEEMQSPRHDADRPRRELPLRDQGRGRRDARQRAASRGQAGDRRARGAGEDRPRRARLLRRKLGGQPRGARARRQRPRERAQGPRRQRAGRRRGSLGDGEPRRRAAARPCRSPPSRAAWSRRCRSPRRSSRRAPSWARACWSSAPTPDRG